MKATENKGWRIREAILEEQGRTIMNNYKNNLYMVEDNAHLISMVPVEELVRFGYEIGLNENCKVLDLCCGYGTLLKVWSETFGITGVGVDTCQEFLSIGRERLVKYGIEKVTDRKSTWSKMPQWEGTEKNVPEDLDLLFKLAALASRD